MSSGKHSTEQGGDHVRTSTFSILEADTLTVASGPLPLSSAEFADGVKAWVLGCKTEHR